MSKISWLYLNWMCLLLASTHGCQLFPRHTGHALMSLLFLRENVPHSFNLVTALLSSTNLENLCRKVKWPWTIFLALFYGSECGTSLWVFHVSLRGMCILLLDKVVCRCHLDPVDWWCAQFDYVLTDFVPAGFVNHWQRCVEIANFKSKFVYFSLQVYQLWPQVFWCFVVKWIHIKDCYAFLDVDSFIIM